MKGNGGSCSALSRQTARATSLGRARPAASDRSGSSSVEVVVYPSSSCRVRSASRRLTRWLGWVALLVVGGVVLGLGSSSGAGVASSGAGGLGSSGLVATPIGVGGGFHPGPGAVTGLAMRGLRCSAARRRGFVVHVEIFARRRVVLLPGGIGVARPRGCAYPIRTTDPTGVIRIAAGWHVTLGDVFVIWRKRLGDDRLLGFRGKVSVYVGGILVRGDPRRVSLTRHAEIVLEIGGYVPPHVRYLFPRGL